MSKKGKGAKGDKEILQQEEVLQAIILADSFDQKFEPITLEEPRALLPLVNIPILDYTLEFLASAGVEEIYIFCCSHAKKIQDYLTNSKWSRIGGILVKTIVGLTSMSAGDALREIFDIGVIKHDFILVQGDVVANMNIEKVLAAHKARREKDKNAIMTMVLKKAEPSHRTRSLQDDIIVAIDKMSGKLLFFESNPESSKVNIDISIFQNNDTTNDSSSSVQIRYDVIDCRIDVCSPEVLALFADNFDYQDIRQDFIKGILTDDILSNKIYAHVISGEYAARVKCLRTYHSVSKDIIHRWTYPMVPDNNLLGDTTTYVMGKGMSYIEKNVNIFDTSTIIKDESVIGDNTNIGSKSIISNSVIGRNCNIGSNVKITGSYIWGDVSIGDNVTINRSIICSGSKILNNTKIDDGCIISWNCVIGPDVSIDKLCKITTSIDNNDDDIDDYIEDIDIGDKGFGKLWIKESDPTNSLVAQIEDKELDMDMEDKISAKSTPQQPVINDQEKFFKEARDIIQSSIIDNHSIDNFTLELNSLKYAFNSTFSDCAVAILQTILDQVKEKDDSKLLLSSQKVISQRQEMLKKFIQSRDDQVEVIWALQDYCDEKERFQRIFPLLLHALYNNDIIEEESIWKWKDEQEDDDTYVKLSKDFLNWLKEAPEEEEEDDDDDEEEDEEDEEDEDENENENEDEDENENENGNEDEDENEDKKQDEDD